MSEDEGRSAKRPKLELDPPYENASDDEEHEEHEIHLVKEPLVDEEYVDNIQPKPEDEVANRPALAVDETRIECLTPGRQVGSKSPHSVVVYWMSRDQRVQDNWALLYAQERAKELGVPLVVVFNLVPVFLNATFRTWAFLVQGLREVHRLLEEKYKISFVLLKGEPHETISKFVEDNNALLVVADFSPLRIARKWKANLVAHTKIPIYQVDAHNIVPVWVASNKQETAARTLRPKIHKVLSRYLVEFPLVSANTCKWEGKTPKIDWDAVLEDFRARVSVQGKEITWLKPGEEAARAHVTRFVENRMKAYAENRNDPTKDAQSNLSPYIHFGTTCSQRIILEAMRHQSKAQASYFSFLEELVVRKELADNFCYYNPNYDNFDGFPQWAKDSLNQHQQDKREHLFTFEQLEQYKTYDRLWNAAQAQMVTTGKMHGYMRMYWGKKLLEWTNNAREAMSFAVLLNDKYELDGRDPNGYVGCAWSIGGVHDQGWKERAVFGKVRYMNFAGCKRKFNVEAYITKYLKVVK
eukprot:Phypoly_transcript_04513.p1 GENE.Phypoly_transcript_04513~~Phypoly_transcript_04513.p1  ORF type:complete len:525 (+),score=68.74 Phypoly_transcript_04513:106-1680(+)